jgi:hypothetical protein
MFTKSFQIAIALFLVLGLAVSFSGVVLAQTTYDTSGATTTNTMDTTGTTDSMDSSGTAPGVPNTGLGGNATSNILLLVISAIVTLAGVGYVYRTSLGVR